MASTDENENQTNNVFNRFLAFIHSMIEKTNKRISMASTDKTDYQIKQIMKYNRDGPPLRQEARHRNLMRFVKQLQARGYGKRWDVHKLGRKDVSRLVDDWRKQGLAHRTTANYMADIRWLANKVGRADQIPSNKDIGVGLRRNDPGYGLSKAVELDRVKLMELEEREQLITELRADFGLRTKEAVKFQHQYATREKGMVALKKSWTKGGRARTIQITNDRQRDLLERVGKFQGAQGDKSNIPSHRTYKSYYRDYNEMRHAAGLAGHEYRHQWAQDRFEQVSGIPSPHAGGPAYQSLSQADKASWDEAAKVVNRELGHGEGRDDITATYIGQR